MRHHSIDEANVAATLENEQMNYQQEQQTQNTERIMNKHPTQSLGAFLPVVRVQGSEAEPAPDPNARPPRVSPQVGRPRCASRLCGSCRVSCRSSTSRGSSWRRSTRSSTPVVQSPTAHSTSSTGPYWSGSATGKSQRCCLMC